MKNCQEGVLLLLAYNLLVRKTERVLEEVQTRHQPDRGAGPSVVRTVQLAELCLQRSPVNHSNQSMQLQACIEKLAKGSSRRSAAHGPAFSSSDSSELHQKSRGGGVYPEVR